MNETLETMAAAQRRALEAHTERAVGRAQIVDEEDRSVGRAVRALARLFELADDPVPAVESTRPIDATAEAATDEAARLVRERDAALANCRSLAADRDAARAAGEQLSLAAVTAERAAKAAREARDASEAKLRDALRDAENVRTRMAHVVSERDKCMAQHADVTKQLTDERTLHGRELAKVKQALDAANEEMNRLRLGARGAPV